VGYLAFVLGLIEGAAFIGWRLTQLPKSQALEFLLVSPVRPKRVFVSEAAVGIVRFFLVQIAGLPFWAVAVVTGIIDPLDLIPLAVMPAVWGIVTGLALTAWVYESLPIRRLGEVLGLLGVLIYLVVGLLFGEQIRHWLEMLPTWLGQLLFEGIMGFHHGNPFGLIRYWRTPGAEPSVAIERFAVLHGVAVVTIIASCWRAAVRLQPHFQDRHYAQIDSDRPAESARIGERPLSWWAVRRVMEYSGRVNLWLAVGVALLYSAFIVAGDRWPPQLGRMVFVIFDSWGGPAGMATILCVLASVPAVFQYGLWDATASDRCRRLELLLLSDLTGKDYAHAALAAAWARGRGYLIGAGVLWLALLVSGRNSIVEMVATVLGAGVLLALSFAIGFRSFATGNQTSGLASLFTMGLPCLLVLLYRTGYGDWAGLLPIGWTCVPVKDGLTWPWVFGVAAGIVLTVAMIRGGLRTCVADLQSWYDRNHGRRRVE
jgi:hypothetical protein